MTGDAVTGDAGLDEAVALLGPWLPQQHWFTGARTGQVGVRVVSASLLSDAEPRLWHLIVEATHDDGTGLVQVPLSVRPERADRLDHVHLGLTSDGHVYDALHDKDATTALLSYFDTGTQAPEGLTFHVEPGAKIPFGERSLVLPGEHQNTNLAYGDVARLKVFRMIEPGLNPDVELHEALTAAGCDLIAPLFGRIDGQWRDGSGTTHTASLAMLQEYLTTASDGWAVATASVRDLYAEGDLHANEVGGDFAGESYRLGMATARVHETLAEIKETSTLTPAEVAGLIGAMHERLDTAVGVVPELEPMAAQLRVHYDTLHDRQRAIPAQRIHGSYHLGQVLRTVHGWKLIDFEGQRELPLAQRGLPRSPMRDIAGMLRSFDYAAQHLLVTDHPPEDPAHDQIVYRAREWAQRNSDSFCAGYRAASQTDPDDEVELIRALEVDIAVVEAVFEARHRPSWLPIPLSALERFAG
ncbi:maltokinase [Haloactinopolyspora alba]|uniref:Maltokinase n=1 Tax=Haloactinopolyspora alba TaxID=648780 RepID=A0A2P8E9H5_9ACTN|nr:aminoglycoside phosphotransferase [Haloactinopolyspora alba]PSL06131.1 maltokinase [Haloactinopolyspora alba]